MYSCRVRPSSGKETRAFLACASREPPALRVEGRSGEYKDLGLVERTVSKGKDIISSGAHIKERIRGDVGQERRGGGQVGGWWPSVLPMRCVEVQKGDAPGKERKG